VAWQYVRERRATASSHEFQTYLPDGAKPSDFVVVYNDSKFAHRGVSDVIMVGGLYKTGGRSLLSTAA